MTLSLDELFESLVLPLVRPYGNTLSAVTIPDYGNYRLAKDSTGAPCLLLRQPSASHSMPIRLQNLTVSYGVSCVISHPNGQDERDTFTIVKCSGGDPRLYPHFLRILGPILMALGTAPTEAAVRRAINGVVTLFQTLTLPPRKSVQGVWAELFIIKQARDPLALIAAWHGLPGERIDFVQGPQRIEVKSASTGRRVHHFSLAQLKPPASSMLLVASLLVESVGNGLSLERLFGEVRALIASEPTTTARFDATFYGTLGANWSDIMSESYDAELATESLRFHRSADIPRPPDPIPAAVENVCFTSDLTAIAAIDSAELLVAGGLFASAVPTA